MTEESVTEAIEWRAPPDAFLSGRISWVTRLAPLVDRPGEWAMVMTTRHAAQVAMQLRNGARRAPAGRWEFIARKDEVFARYLGESE